MQAELELLSLILLSWVEISPVGLLPMTMTFYDNFGLDFHLGLALDEAIS